MGARRDLHPGQSPLVGRHAVDEDFARQCRVRRHAQEARYGDRCERRLARGTSLSVVHIEDDLIGPVGRVRVRPGDRAPEEARLAACGRPVAEVPRVGDLVAVHVVRRRGERHVLPWDRGRRRGAQGRQSRRAIRRHAGRHGREDRLRSLPGRRLVRDRQLRFCRARHRVEVRLRIGHRRVRRRQWRGERLVDNPIVVEVPLPEEGVALRVRDARRQRHGLRRVR